jgi:hypothetical protein
LRLRFLTERERRIPYIARRENENKVVKTPKAKRFG